MRVVPSIIRRTMCALVLSLLAIGCASTTLPPYRYRCIWAPEPIVDRPCTPETDGMEVRTVQDGRSARCFCYWQAGSQDEHPSPAEIRARPSSGNFYPALRAARVRPAQVPARPSSGNSPTSTPPTIDTTSDLIGSRWHIVYDPMACPPPSPTIICRPSTEHFEYDLIFLANGRLDENDPIHEKHPFLKHDETWKMVGEQIIMDFGDQNPLLKGHLIDHDTMVGSGTNPGRLTWKWTAHRI